MKKKISVLILALAVFASACLAEVKINPPTPYTKAATDTAITDAIAADTTHVLKAGDDMTGPLGTFGLYSNTSKVSLAKDANYTVLESDERVDITVSGTGTTVTLPLIDSGTDGQKLLIYKTGAQSSTISPSGGDTIGGAASNLLPLTTWLVLEANDVRNDWLVLYDSNHTHAFTAITGTAAVTQGGTDATTAAGARTNLGVGYVSGSATYNPPSLLTLVGATTNVTATGAAMGDFVVVSFSLATAGVIFSGSVSATDTVTVTLFNSTVGTVNLDEGVLRVRVWAQ